jgi:hypothetical protein
MKLLKDYWFLIVFIFGLGGWVTKLQINIDVIENKMDRREYFNIREKDSLRALIRDNEIIRLKREVNLQPETTKQEIKSDKLTPAKVEEIK